MLDGVKKTLGRLPMIGTKMATGSPPHSTPKNGDHLLTHMNIPALAARQDAAYDRAVSLLSGDIFSLSEQTRRELYAAVLKLLDISRKTSLSLPSTTTDRHEPRHVNPIHQYLTLLKDTVQAAYALVTHEMIIFQEEKQLSDFIGSEVSTQFRSTDEIFSDSEMNVFHCVNDLIEMAQPAIARQRERMQKSFSKSVMERYEKSLKEFTALYKTIGRKEEKPAAEK